MIQTNIYGVDYLSTSKKYVSARFGDQGEIVHAFLIDKQLEGRKAITLYKYVKDLFFWKGFLGKPFSACELTDIKAGVAGLQAMELSDGTKQRRKIALKVFYRWLLKDENPPLVSWIRTHLKQRHYISPQLLLLPEDVHAMLVHARTLQERTLLLLHWETGGRIGETLGLRVQDVSFEGKLALILLDGKTGPRPVYLFEARPYLEQLILEHPQKDAPGAPLFLNQHGRQLRYTSCCTSIRTMAQKAGIKKPVNTHAFRHGRATFHARMGWNEPQLRAYHGWVPDSKMVGVYVHLAASDMKAAVLKLHAAAIPSF